MSFHSRLNCTTAGGRAASESAKNSKIGSSYLLAHDGRGFINRTSKTDDLTSLYTDRSSSYRAKISLYRAIFITKGRIVSDRPSDGPAVRRKTDPWDQHGSVVRSGSQTACPVRTTRGIKPPSGQKHRRPTADSSRLPTRDDGPSSPESRFRSFAHLFPTESAGCQQEHAVLTPDSAEDPPVSA